jgi:hypothetical protein
MICFERLKDMATCQGCSTELTNENSAPSVVARKRGMCRDCKGVYLDSHRQKNPKSWLLYASRQRSKLSGLHNTLTLADIPDIPDKCPVFPWITLEHRVGTGSDGRDSSPSLDRVDNTRGYVPGNVRIISFRANLLKRDATDKELAALGIDATKRKT